jgi:uncharacterized protein YkwD
MRMLSLIACLLMASSLLAEEQTTDNSQGSEASTAQAAQETSAEPQQDADMTDTASETETQQGTAKAEEPKPLHKHPTLLKMLTRNNFLRKRSSRHAQKMNEDLTEAAQDQANYMARTGYYDHYVNGNPSARATRHGFRGAYAGEIIHRGPSTIDGAFDGWMRSPPHHSILMGGAQEAGFGYAVSTGGTAYWVGLYGTAAAKKPVSGSGESNLSGSTNSTVAATTYSSSTRQRRRARRRNR